MQGREWVGIGWIDESVIKVAANLLALDHFGVLLEGYAALNKLFIFFW